MKKFARFIALLFVSTGIATGQNQNPSDPPAIEPNKTAPLAVCKTTTQSGLAPFAVCFDASQSHDPDGQIVSYAWDFGDGATATGALTQHVYTRPDSYRVALTVIDNDGLAKTTTSLVRVSSQLLPRMPICGDQDGSETPLVFNCAEFISAGNVQTFQVPGAGPADLRFDFVFREAGYNNEFGLIIVDDPAGSVSGLLPGSPGYYSAAFARARVIFPSGSTANTPDVTLSLNGGSFLMFFIIQDNTLTNLRINNPNNLPNRLPLAFFSLDALNPDHFDHFVGFLNTVNNYTQFGFEDLTGGGDQDFDDIVYNINVILHPLQALAATKTAAQPMSRIRENNGYTITISNANNAAVNLAAIIDSLSADFSYRPGSSHGATTSDPAITGQVLRWNGPFILPALSNLTLSFGVVVPATPGEYFNNVAGNAGLLPVTPSGNTAKITVLPDTMQCRVEITSPAEGEVICNDSALVCLATQVSGGIPPITKVCTINGAAVADSCAFIALVNGRNLIAAQCTFTDAQGNTCTSFDTVTVWASLLKSSLTITAPKDGAFLCANTINVSGISSVSGGQAPYRSVCTINGNTVSSGGGSFGGVVALVPGYNTIIAACTFTDTLSCSTTCRDTVTVFSDATPPEATFSFNNLPVITGEVRDNESGIAKIEIVEIHNRVVTIAPFKVGDSRVTFSSDKIDPNLRSGFVLRITNRAGCSVLADPVYVRLDPVAGTREFSFNMLHTDRFLYVNNHGLPKINILINDRALNLVANEEGTGRSGNTYFMSKEGQRLIDISSYLHEGENQVQVKCDATATGSADLLFADVQLGEIDNSIILPTAFALNQNYPNPFNPETHIAFDIPASWTAPVTLRIFNMQGQLMQTLVDGVMSPGRHEVVWNGRDTSGQPVATGMYFYQILSGKVKAVKKMQMVK